MRMHDTDPVLWRTGQFVEDDWQFPGDSADLPPDGKIAVTKARYLRERRELIDRDGEIGICLASGELLGEIEADLHRLSLIVLHFPKYTDGRSYSTARILRDRHGYSGELRARGDVLRDQISFMLRVGIDSLEIVDPGTIQALRSGRVGMVRHHYQPCSVTAEIVDVRSTQRRISNRL